MIGVSSMPVRIRERSKQLIVQSNWRGNVYENIMVFPLQNSTIKKQQGVIWFFAASNFDQATRSSSVVEFCNGNAMMSSQALPHQLEEYNYLILCSFMHGRLCMPDTPIASLDVSLCYSKTPYSNSNQSGCYHVSYHLIWAPLVR